MAAAYPQATLRFALVLYKDAFDTYETREFDFGSIAELEANLAVQSAGGGGDWPEAVHSGLDKLTKLSWQSDARMAFWIADIKNVLGITGLMVEHDMSLVSKVSDRVLAMSQGEELATGTPAQVQSHPGVIEAYLGSMDDVSGLRRPKTPAAAAQGRS